MRGKRIVSGALVAAFAAGILALGAPVAVASSSEEAQFVSKINAERRQRGLNALVVRSDLVAVARRHSGRMADDGTIYHNDNIGNEVGGNWTVLGENVGMGPSVDSLHTAFMNSKHHRDNILYRTFNEIGVGIVRDGDTIYVTEVFAHRTSGGSVPSSGGSSSSGSSSSYSAAAPAPVPVAPPKPRSRPAKPTPTTVETLVRVLGLDANEVDPATGRAAGV